MQVVYAGRGGSVTLEFSDDWRMQPQEELLAELRQPFGKQSVQVIYGGVSSAAARR